MALSLFEGMPMTMREVDSSHKWNAEGYCMGCATHVHDPTAQQVCAQPYRPRPRVYHPGGLPADPSKGKIKK